MARSAFFAGARSDGSASLVNERTGDVLAAAVEIAGTSESRRRGLLGRDRLAPSTALVIVPCSAIHTFFMRFAIDVVFIGRDGRVLKIVRGLRPWRMAGSLHAHATIEMASGSLAPSALSKGDRLSLTTS